MQPVCRLPEHKQRKQIVLPLLLLPLLPLQVSLCSLPFFHACLLLSFWASSSLCSQGECVRYDASFYFFHTCMNSAHSAEHEYIY